MNYTTVNPVNGDVVAEAPRHTDDEIEAALAAADSAFGEWRARSVEERAAVLLRAGDLFEERGEELAQLITAEMGKRITEARGEVALSRGIFTYYGERGPEFMAPSPVQTTAKGTASVEKLPLGALLGIMPWNFPSYQLLRFAVPNLIAGNVVLIKPAESCSGSALFIEQLLHDAGVPAGAYTTVLASHDQIATIIADPRIQGVSLTGSERAGMAVGKIAAAYLKKTVLELGGSDPYIVLDATDVDAAAASAWSTRISNMGQSCNSNKRMIVNSDIFDDFVEKLTRRAAQLQPGNPVAEDDNGFAPLASRRAAEELAAQVQDAVDKGATLHAGGYVVDGPGAYFAPAVLTGVDESMRAYHEELFGPVAVVYKVDSDEEAVQLANDSEYGLGAAVFSQDEARAKDVAVQLNTGMTHVNTAAEYGAELPFGGIKRSGFGRELGPEGMDEFVNKRLLFVAS